MSKKAEKSLYIVKTLLKIKLNINKKIKLVMNEDIVLKFCITYLNPKVHLCMSFQKKKFKQNSWTLMG